MIPSDLKSLIRGSSSSQVDHAAVQAAVIASKNPEAIIEFAHVLAVKDVKRLESALIDCGDPDDLVYWSGAFEMHNPRKIRCAIEVEQLKIRRDPVMIKRLRDGVDAASVFDRRFPDVAASSGVIMDGWKAMKYIMSNNLVFKKSRESFERLIVAYGVPECAMAYARAYPFADVNKIAPVVIKHGTPDMILEFALDVTGADIRRLQVAMAQKGTPEDMVAFVDQVHDADPHAASSAVTKSSDIELLKSFSLVPGADVPLIYDRLHDLSGRSVNARKAKAWMISMETRKVLNPSIIDQFFNN